MTALLVAVAGAAGALTRYGIGHAFGVRSFPWATLAINLSGSFLFGVVLSLAVKRQWPDTATLPLAVGFLGAYTTFSTFSYESFTLLRTDRATAAVIYVVVSVLGGLLAAWAGFSAARSLA